MRIYLYCGCSPVATISSSGPPAGLSPRLTRSISWPVVAICSCDRFLRIVRQFFCNLHVSLSGKVQGTKSTASYDQEMDMIRLEVVPGGKFLTLKPNQHYFLYLPGGGGGRIILSRFLVGVLHRHQPPTTTLQSQSITVSKIRSQVQTRRNSNLSPPTTTQTTKVHQESKS
jgi:hypothetical protein